jgi:SAM-dependent methyltransferase
MVPGSRRGAAHASAVTADPDPAPAHDPAEAQARGAAAALDVAKRRAWAGTAAAYAETLATLCAHAVPALLDAAGARPGDRVLDVGTGPGTVALAAAARGCTVTGVDPDPEMVGLARAAVPGARLLVGALPDLPAEVGGGYDVVAANFVLNHVGDPLAAAAALARAARPGGRVAVSVWPVPPGPAQQLWADVLARAGVRPASATVPAARDFPRTPGGLASLLSGAGLGAVDAGEIGFEHVVDPDLWWSAVERGVASIGAAYRGQTAAGRCALREAFVELAAGHTGPDGRLHLPARAIVGAGRATA